MCSTLCGCIFIILTCKLCLSLTSSTLQNVPSSIFSLLYREPGNKATRMHLLWTSCTYKYTRSSCMMFQVHRRCVQMNSINLIENMYASLPPSNAVSMAKCFYTPVTLEHNNLANPCSLIHGMWVNKSTKICLSRHLMGVCSTCVTCVQCLILNLWGSGLVYNCM